LIYITIVIYIQKGPKKTHEDLHQMTNEKPHDQQKITGSAFSNCCVIPMVSQIQFWGKYWTGSQGFLFESQGSQITQG